MAFEFESGELALNILRAIDLIVTIVIKNSIYILLIFSFNFQSFE